MLQYADYRDCANNYPPEETEKPIVLTIYLSALNEVITIELPTGTIIRGKKCSLTFIYFLNLFLLEYSCFTMLC